MGKIGVFYGSSTGTTEDVAGRIALKLNLSSEDVHDVSTMTAESIAAYDSLILGTSTWGSGEMQDDWYDGVKVLKSISLNSKKIALFGCGDSESYSDEFCNGLGELYDELQGKGAEFIGTVSTEGYSYDDTSAERDGELIGLLLDEMNESDLTDERIDAWVASIRPQL